MNKTIIWIVIAVVVLGGLVWWGMAGKGPELSGPVKVGVIMPITGDAAEIGESSRNVIQIAADEINAAGGVNGQPIELIIEDGKCNGTDAANAMQKLANVDKVQVVIGAGCSGESLAAVPVAQQAKVAMLSPVSSSPKLTGMSEYFARNYPSDAFQAKVFAQIAKEKGYANVAMISEQTDYAQALADTFSKEFSAAGGTVVAESFLTDTSDFRTPLTKLKASEPQALLIIAQSNASGERLLKQLRDLGWKPQLFVSDTIIGSASALAGYADILEGAIGAEFGFDASNQKFATMVAAYKAKFGSEPPYQAYQQANYDAVYLVAEAVGAVGYDGTKIANWLHTNVKNWQGAAGSVTIGADGDPTVGHKPEVISGGKVSAYTK
jgi:branched-chain amino acid transport system substrate-binding protein